MTDIVYKKKKISSYNIVQYHCFRSGEIKESGADLEITIAS